MERVEPLDHDPDFERPIDPRRKSSTARRFGWPLLMVAAVALAAFLLWRGTHAPEPAPVASAPPSAPAASEAATAPPPGTPRYPIESVTPQAAAETPLPALADSDHSLQDVLASLFAGAPLDRIFHMEQIVPRFVATIETDRYIGWPGQALAYMMGCREIERLRREISARDGDRYPALNNEGRQHGITERHHQAAGKRQGLRFHSGGRRLRVLLSQLRLPPDLVQ